jgi:hypothetical protein
MFRIKRTRWISLGLVLAVLLLPLPASAGGLWETATQSWEGAWRGLLDWLGLAPIAVETTCIMIDPDGCPSTGSEDPEPPPGTESCAAIDPLGCPGS